MSIYDILLLAIGLSADAFAISLCKGMALKKVKLSHMCILGLWFGGFQGLMPIIGYFAGSTFEHLVSRFAPWIAFVLLALIGGNMIKEALSKDDDCQCKDGTLEFKTMFGMAVATSIDALTVGVTFSVTLNGILNVLSAAGIIGAITFVVSAVGVKIGSVGGAWAKDKAEMLGGTVLILLGIKILLDGLGIINL